MLRFLVLLVLAASLLACSGRLPEPEIVAAHMLGRATNEAIVELAAVERAEGSAEIQDSQTAPEARARLAAVEERWAPIWSAVEAFREAHDAYVDALEGSLRVPDSLVAPLRTTYCLVRVEARRSVILPDFPGEPCP